MTELTPIRRETLKNLLHEVGFEAYLHIAEEEARITSQQENSPTGHYPFMLAWDKIRQELRRTRLYVSSLLTHTDE